jgi:NitT/TauT family transport system substrate-binding protein
MDKTLSALLIVVALAVAGASGCNKESGQDASKKEEKIIVAVTPWPASAALYVARDKGYFKDEGVDVSFDSYISGHLGLDAVLSGKSGSSPCARSGAIMLF